MEDYEAFDLAEEARSAADRLNELIETCQGDYLGSGTRERLLDVISNAAASLGGCITMLGEGPGADPAMSPTLAMVSQQVWDAVRGLQPNLMHPRPWPERGDPVALMRAHLAVQGWDAGTQHGRAGQTPYQTGARGPRDYLSRITSGDAAEKVLAGIGLGKWAADPAAEVAIAAYCESYAAAAGRPLPGAGRLADIRYLPGQQVTDLWGTKYVLDGSAAPGGSPLAEGAKGPSALFHRAAIRAPLALEFPSEEAARTAMETVAAQGRAYPVADGDVLAVPGVGTWLACGTDMVPAASFTGGGRYAGSIRLAQAVTPPRGPDHAAASSRAAAVAHLGFPGKVSLGERPPQAKGAAPAPPLPARVRRSAAP
jgi:hypothetical protein